MSDVYVLAIGRTSWCDTRNDCATFRRKSKLARKRSRQLLDLDAELARDLHRLPLLRAAYARRFHQAYAHIMTLAVAQHDKRHHITRMVQRDEALELIDALHAPAIHLDNHIVSLEPGALRR